MPNGDRGPLNKMLQTALVLNALTVILLAVAVVLGGVAMRTKLRPQPIKIGDAVRLGPTLVIEDQTYNLGEADRYMKATIVLELDVDNLSQKEASLLEEEVKKREPQIRDRIIKLVSGKNFVTMNSKEGKDKFKEELRKEIDYLLSRGRIKTIIFTAFALQ